MSSGGSIRSYGGALMDDDADDEIVSDADADPDATEILRIAMLLMDRHGPDALAVVRVSACRALQSDCFDEYLVWLDIEEAVVDLIACSPSNITTH
jgi:hypothetical protein